MPPYEEMYYHLFNAITDALALLSVGQNDRAAALLRAAQCWGEERYINAEDNAE